MKKYVIYSDPHVCKYTSIVRKRGTKYSVRLENLIQSLSWVEHLAEENNCDAVICGGDYYNSPNLDAEEITASQDIYFSKMPHIMLTGNHDSSVASLEYSSIKLLKSHNAEIITEPKMIMAGNVEIYFIPYITCHERLLLSDYVKPTSNKKIIITHNDLAGIQYGRFMSESGFDVANILENCSLFLDGHLHNGYTISDKIVLLGNLTGANFNEDASKFKHYAYILTINDDDSINLDYYENPYALNFYKLNINSDYELARLDHLANNAVVSVSCLNTLLEKVEAYIKTKSNIIEYKLLATYNTYEGEDSIDFVVEDHFKQFIEFAQTKIDPSPILTEELTLLGGN